jgi:hypothetical protein
VNIYLKGRSGGTVQAGGLMELKYWIHLRNELLGSVSKGQAFLSTAYITKSMDA